MSAKLSFELDAGKVLAKLHRGGCQTHDKMLFFNTGITNDANIKPEEVDKNKINFDMEAGEYELGVIFDDELQVKFQMMDELANANVELEKDEKFKNAVTELCKTLVQRLGDKKLDTLKDSDWKKILQDDFKYEKKDKVQPELLKKFVEKIYADVVKQKEKTDEKTPITQNPDENNKPVNESQADGGNTKERDYTKMANIQAANADLLTVVDPKGIDIAARAKDAPNEVQANLKKNEDIIKKFMEQNIRFAVTYLQSYMQTFAGEDQSKKITAENIVVTYVPEKYADPYKNAKYANYQIPALSDEEVRQEKIKQLQEMAKSGKNQVSFKNMCFKIGYSLNTGR